MNARKIALFLALAGFMTGVIVLTAKATTLEQNLNLLQGTPVPCAHLPVTSPGEAPIQEGCEQIPQPVSTPPATCDPAPASCYQERVVEFQPRRRDLRPNLTGMAGDLFPLIVPGSTLPYPLIYHGDPPKLIPVSIGQPIPPVLLRGLFWAESRWIQFGESELASDNTYACTLVSGDCGYGASQLTSCMTIGGFCGINNLDRGLVGGDFNYNVSAGMNVLINTWNSVLTIGSNDHTQPEHWYEAILGYNGWSRCNDPNRETELPVPCGRGDDGFDRNRAPFGEEDSFAQREYPYQEVVWGWTASPSPVSEPYSPSRNLWRPTRIAHLPRGIFGLGADGWEPPETTPKPEFHLLYNVWANEDGSSVIQLYNPSYEILAADIGLYNDDHTFNRWLLPDDDLPNIRIFPLQTRSLPVAAAFSKGSFRGYARISASQGLEIELMTPLNYDIFLPVIQRPGGPNIVCQDILDNGGFEQFQDGRLVSWQARAADRVHVDYNTYLTTYPLADGTWFLGGHYGAYLGGYNHSPDEKDELWQTNIVFSTQYDANDPLYLRFAWFVQTEETVPGVYDRLQVFIEDESGKRELTDLALSNDNADNHWHELSINLRRHGIQPGDTFTLSFEADLDLSSPTSFFIDNVRIDACSQP